MVSFSWLPIHRVKTIFADYSYIVRDNLGEHYSYSLSNLSLDYCDGLSDIIFVKNFPNLISLSMMHCYDITDINPIEILDKLENLNICML